MPETRAEILVETAETAVETAVETAAVGTSARAAREEGD